MVVRNSWMTQGREAAGFVDAAEFERIQRNGDMAIKRWINDQLNGTSVTVVLVGRHTCTSRWVQYEIEKSIEIGNGLLGIDVSKIRNLQGEISERCAQIPQGCPFYLWFKADGYRNIGSWIEDAAKAASR